MVWIFNGLLIQDLNDFTDCQCKSPYLGIGRYISWPLSKRNDEISKELTKEANERWFNYYSGNEYVLAVISSVDYIKRYIKACKDCGISIRVLYIETNRNRPKCFETYLKKEFLGYDYATSQDFFSALYDDLYGFETPNNLVDFNSKLNVNGLFDDIGILISYIENRNKAINDGYELEQFGDFCKYKISLISDLSVF